jgi:hypothetical protein
MMEDMVAEKAITLGCAIGDAGGGCADCLQAYRQPPQPINGAAN